MIRKALPAGETRTACRVISPCLRHIDADQTEYEYALPRNVSALFFLGRRRPRRARAEDILRSANGDGAAGHGAARSRRYCGFGPVLPMH